MDGLLRDSCVLENRGVFEQERQITIELMLFGLLTQCQIIVNTWRQAQGNMQETSAFASPGVATTYPDNKSRHECVVYRYMSFWLAHNELNH